MIEAILVGAGFAFAAAVQPGPLQAYFLSSVAQRGWRASLPAGFAPLVSDGPIAAIILMVLDQVPAWFTNSLQGVGGLFLIYLAYSGLRNWQKNTLGAELEKTSAPRTLLKAATINFLNPNVYIAWSLVLGPAIMAAWNRNPEQGIAMILAFYATIVATGSVIIFFLGTTRFLGSKGQRTLILISVLLLAFIGIYQVLASLRGFALLNMTVPG